jgi:hypothetical protein
VRRRQRASWDKLVTNLELGTHSTQSKVYKTLQQITKDIKETAKIQGNIDENVSMQYYEKLWNTTNINNPEIEWNSYHHLDTSITLD